MHTVGTLAPNFSLIDETGTPRELAKQQGSWVVLYFYPKDDTPGCTAEACGIRDRYDQLVNRDVVVLGVSRDSVESHAAFKRKYDLPFPLLSDETGEVSAAYHAITPEQPSQHAARITYLIDPSGCIAKVYPKVSPADHADELLRDLECLQRAAEVRPPQERME
mgnify:CR=1 FL=1